MRRLALRQRLHPRRTGGGLLPAGGYFRALSADARQRRRHGVRQRRARDAGDHHRRPARRVAGRRPRAIPERVSADVGEARNRLRPVHLHPHRQPRRSRPRRVLADARKGLHLQRHDGAGVLPVRRPLSARPLRGRRVSALRRRRRARRPVRRMRTDARPGRAHRHVLPTVRRRAGDTRDRTLLHAPERLRRPVARMDAAARPLQAQRPQLHHWLPRRRLERQGYHARPRLGRPRPARRLRRQAHLRLVRGGHRLPVRHERVGGARRRTRPLARFLARPERARLLLHGQRQHTVPHRHLARHAHGIRRAEPALRRSRQRVPEHRRRQGFHKPRLGGVDSRHSGALRRGFRPLRARRQHARNRRFRIQLGGFRPAKQR